MNLFADLPANLPDEVITPLLERDRLRIERIVSLGQTSPEGFWYDQDDHEWVIVLRGKGAVEFDDGSVVELNEGDYLNIPAHSKHRVSFTDPSHYTVWLAVHYR